MGKHVAKTRPGRQEHYKAGPFVEFVDRLDVTKDRMVDRLASRLAVLEQTARYSVDVLREARNPRAAATLGAVAAAPVISVEIADVPSEVITDENGRIVSIPTLENELAEHRHTFSPERYRHSGNYDNQTQSESERPPIPSVSVEQWRRHKDGAASFSLKAGQFPDGKRMTLWDTAERLFIPGGWQALHEQNPHIKDPNVLLSGIDKIEIKVDKPLEYTIKSGDTLSEIAERTNVFTVQDLMDFNPDIKDADRILAGDALTIPFETKGWHSYTVQSGDTLGNYGFEIDGAGGVETSTIARMNLLKDPNLIIAGTTILLPEKPSSSMTAAIEADEGGSQSHESRISETDEKGTDNNPSSDQQDENRETHSEEQQTEETDQPQPEEQEETDEQVEDISKDDSEAEPEPEREPTQAPKPAPGTLEVTGHLNTMNQYTEGFVPTAEELKGRDKETFDKLVEQYVKAEQRGEAGEFLRDLRDEQVKDWAKEQDVNIDEAIGQIVSGIARSYGLDWDVMNDERRELWQKQRAETIESIRDGKSFEEFKQEFSQAVTQARNLHDMFKDTNSELGELSAELAASRAVSVMNSNERDLVVGLARWMAGDGEIRTDVSAEFIIGERLVFALRNEIALPMNNGSEIEGEWIEELGRLYVEGEISFSELGDIFEQKRNEIRGVYDLFHRFTSPKKDWPKDANPTVPGDSVRGPLLDERVLKLLTGDMSLTKLRTVLAEHYAEDYGVEVDELYRVMAWLIMDESGIDEGLRAELDDGIGKNLANSKITLNDVMVAAGDKDTDKLKELALELHAMKLSGKLRAYLPANHGPVNSEGYMAMPESVEGKWKFESFTPPADRCAWPETIARVATVAELWSELDYPPLVLGDFNAEDGHVSHVNGVDIDLDSVARGFAAGDMTKPGYDKEASFMLAKLFAEVDSDVVIFYNDIWVIEKFNAWAEANGYGARMSWVDNHHHHFHARFSLPKGQYSGACAADTVFEGDGGGVKKQKPDKPDRPEVNRPHPAHDSMKADLPSIRKVSRKEVVDGDWGTQYKAESFALGIIAAVAEGNKPDWADRDKLVDVISTFWHESANGYVHARGDVGLGHPEAESNGWCQMYYAPHKSWGKAAVRLPENNMDIWQHLNNCYDLYAETRDMSHWMAHKTKGGPSSEYEAMFGDIVDGLLDKYDIDW